MDESKAASFVMNVLGGQQLDEDWPTPSQKHIIKAIALADHAERIVISMAYPELVEAVSIFQTGLSGVNTLIERVIG